MPCVYILRCGDGSLYTGSTRDLPARLRRHEAGQASRYTRSRLPVTLAWTREVPNWKAALREEHRIKRLRRTEKEKLVGQAGHRRLRAAATCVKDAVRPGAARRAGDSPRTRTTARRPSRPGR